MLAAARTLAMLAPDLTLDRDLGLSTHADEVIAAIDGTAGKLGEEWSDPAPAAPMCQAPWTRTAWSSAFLA